MPKNFESFNGRPGTVEEIKERIEHVSNIVVEHPTFVRLFEEIYEHHTYMQGCPDPEGICIFGDSGTGKSTLIEQYIRRYPRVNLEKYTRIPVLYVRVPSGAKEKNIASAILNRLGDLFFDKGTEQQMTDRAVRLIETCEVELIIFDEFQHLIDSDTKKVLRKVADWLKKFCDEVKIPIVLCGLTESTKIFKANEQLDGRFETRETLPPFQYNSHEDVKNFRAFLHSINQELPFVKPSNLADPKLAEKLYYVSLGLPRYIMKLLKKATKYAVKHGQDYLSEDYFELACRNMKQSGRPYLVNPFCIGDFNIKEYIEREKKS